MVAVTAAALIAVAIEAVAVVAEVAVTMTAVAEVAVSVTAVAEVAVSVTAVAEVAVAVAAVAVAGRAVCAQQLLPKEDAFVVGFLGSIFNQWARHGHLGTRVKILVARSAARQTAAKVRLVLELI
jgi:hypothetical protein